MPWDSAGRVTKVGRVVPVMRVRFTISFQHGNVFLEASQESTPGRAFIEVVGDGVTVLDAREVQSAALAS
jgi:hypothetical protein